MLETSKTAGRLLEREKQMEKNMKIAV